MISYILDILLCGITVIGEITGLIITAGLIQLISYRVFGVNLYAGFIKIMFKEVSKNGN